MLRKLLDIAGKPFAKGRLLERAEPLYEAIDTCMYSPAHVTRGASHVRDALDLKRMMGLVVVSLFPCIFMAMYNTGYQASLVMGENITPYGWQGDLLAAMGLTLDGFIGKVVYGAMFFIPVLNPFDVFNVTSDVVFYAYVFLIAAILPNCENFSCFFIKRNHPSSC